jgi:methylthioxylose transferase
MRNAANHLREGSSPTNQAANGLGTSSGGSFRHSLRGALGGTVAFTIAAAFVGWATVWGRRVQKNPDVKLGAAPLVGQWKFRPSIGYLMPIGLALLVVIAVPRLYVRLHTRWVVLSSVGLSAAFTAALAGADGRVAMLAPVVHGTEYWYWLDKFPPVRQMLAVYDEYDFILNFSTHIKGHPPGYVLLLKGLAALGLAKPWIVASLSYMSAGLVAGSVLVVARRFGSANFTRKAAPFLILAPYALWMGTSADAVFSALVAMGAAGIALAATSQRRNRKIAFAFIAGLLLGASFYSAWGTVTCGPIIIAALWCGSTSSTSTRSTSTGSESTRFSSLSLPTHKAENDPNLLSQRKQTSKVTIHQRVVNIAPVTLAAVGGIGVVAAGMTALGYNWFAGIGLTRRLYWKGTAQFRPWRYFLVGNLGAVLIAIGGVAIIGMGTLGFGRIQNRSSTNSHNATRNQLSEDTSNGGTSFRWLRVFVLAGLICVLAADFSQYSKGEVERIWLPFMPWLTLPAAILARHRFWLILQSCTAIGIQVMLISKW